MKTPHWPFSWIRKVLNPKLAEHIEGDLNELFEDYMAIYPKWKAQVFYYLDCVRIIRPHLFRSFKSNSTITTMFLHNFKLGYRNLKKYKNYTTINLLGLILGLFASITLYRVVKYEASFNSWHPNLDNLYRMAEYHPEYEVYYQTRTPAAEKIKEEIPEVLNATRFFSPTSLWLEYNDIRLSYELTFVDPDFASMFSFKVLEGNLEQALTTKNQLIITNTLSKAFFGYEKAVGKVLRSPDGTTQYEIGAVLEDPPGNSSLQYELILSWQHIPEWLKEAGDWNNTFMESYLMLQEGTSPQSLAQKFRAIEARYFAEDDRSQFHPVPFAEYHSLISSNKDTLKTLTIIALVISLISFVNFINLLTAQSLTRLKEVGVKKVLGSTMTHFLIQFSIETSLVCILSGLIAVVLSFLFTPLINDFFQLNLSNSYSVFFDLWVLTFLSTLVVGILAGLYPALYLANKNIIQSLKGDLKRASQRQYLQKMLIILQYSASIVLITGSFIIWDQISFMKNKNLSLDKENVVVVELDFTSFPDMEKSAEKVKLFRQLINNQPFVHSTAFAWNTPGHYDYNYNEFDDPNGNAQKVHLRQTTIDASVVPTLGMEIVHGRNFNETIKTEKDVVLINESAFEAMGWSSIENKEIKPHGDGKSYRVLGVVKDFHYQSVANEIEPMIFWYAGPDPVSRMLLVKYSQGKVEDAIDFLKEHWHMTGSLASLDYFFLDTTYDKLYQSEEKTGLIISSFSVVGIFLASLGLFALATFTIRKRIKEIGIRKVMGASSIQITGLLSRNYLILILIAIVISYPLLWYLGNEYLNQFAYRIEINPVFMIVSTAVVLVIVFLSVGSKSFKAASLNPSISLRDE